MGRSKLIFMVYDDATEVYVSIIAKDDCPGLIKSYCLGYGTCSLLGLQPFIALDMELVPS
jgi:hypothetical protein